jgi:hypothetical protein
MDPIPGIGIALISNPIPIDWTTGIGWSNPITIPGISFLIQSVTFWMIPKCEAHGLQPLGVGLGLQCDNNPVPIPWDWIARVIQSLIFLYLVSKN